ncbi:MAG: xanthine dehydrogenase family protein subunit M [bacterium]|nr:xanthine dehydrogenase family protein subunit M [bacterium]
MNAFEYVNPSSLRDVASLLGDQPDRKAVVIAGGIDLLGELKDELIAPERLVNLKALPDLKYIRSEKKALKIGATTTLTEIATHAEIGTTYAALAQAAESVASLQIRNVGTIGGNLCQRPRCWYYRSNDFHCLKKGGNMCYAVGGNNKYHAILGGDPCYIVHPSDLAPALIALDARIRIQGARGRRNSNLEDFYVLPEKQLNQETVLRPDEVVTEIEIPTPKEGTRSVYLKFKEKGTMDFALSAVAVVVQVDAGVCRSARIVLGGVAPTPWRVQDAERILTGQRITENLAVLAAEAALAGAAPMDYNAYKVSLTKTLVRRAVMAVAS